LPVLPVSHISFLCWLLGPTGLYLFSQQSHLSRTPPIMYFQKLKWIIEEALAAHRPISYSALFFETALSALIGINLRKSSSPSVGAREVRRGGEGLYGRPRPVPCAHLWRNALTPPQRLLFVFLACGLLQVVHMRSLVDCEAHLVKTQVSHIDAIVTTDASVTSDAKLPHMPSSLRWGGWRREVPVFKYLSERLWGRPSR